MAYSWNYSRDLAVSQKWGDPSMDPRILGKSYLPASSGLRLAVLAAGDYDPSAQVGFPKSGVPFWGSLELD